MVESRHRHRRAVALLSITLPSLLAVFGLLALIRPATAGAALSIQVVKVYYQANGLDQVSGPWSFDFDCSIPGYGPPDCDNLTTLTNSAPQYTLNYVQDYQTVTLTETSTSTAYTTSVSCIQGTTVIATGTKSVTFSPQSRSNITCTFTNTQTCPDFPLTVSNESELNTAITCYNLETAPGEYRITLGSPILLTQSTVPVNNATAGVSLRVVGGGNGLDAQYTGGVLPLEIKAGSDVAMEDLSIVGGRRLGGSGGAIVNEGSLMLQSVRLEDNVANYGGALLNAGTAVITRSVVISNSASSGGGGIANAGLLNVDASTFAENRGNGGGAIASLSSDSYTATLSIANSSFYSNTSDGAAGALLIDGFNWNSGKNTIVNSTFSGNSASRGSGLYLFRADLRIANSTFANNASNGSFLQATIVAGEFCFTADMRIRMADGTTKRIADVKVGDRVISYDFAAGHEGVGTVQAADQRQVGQIVHLNGIETTAEHPFAVGPDEWRKASELEVGDRVLTASGWTRITSKWVEERRETVYNITVSGAHNYYVAPPGGGEAYLVHNKLLADVVNTLQIDNTIITNSQAEDCILGFGQTLSGSNNLIDDFDTGDCADISDEAVTGLDPNLADNSGPTLTHALLAGSNAINGGDNALAVDAAGDPLETDQRLVPFARVRDTTVDVGAFESQDEPDPVDACPSGDPAVGASLTLILGVGMGSTTTVIAAPAITVANPSAVNALYAQLVGKQVNKYTYARFIYANGTYINDKTKESAAFRNGSLFWYGQALDPGKPISKVKARLIGAATAKPFVQRAFLLYPTYTMPDRYASVAQRFTDSSAYFVDWKTAEGWQQTFAPVLAIPELQAARDVTVQVVVVDVDGDGRQVQLTVEAGGVSYNRVISAPGNGKLLNLVTVTLEDVPAGTDEVNITLTSPTGAGDSAGMVGAAASYPCLLPQQP